MNQRALRKQLEERLDAWPVRNEADGSVELPASANALDGVVVVLPCYRSAGSVAEVVRRIPSGVRHIVCVNDASDDGLSDVLATLSQKDSRIEIVTHETNGGVGQATVTGYRRAMELGARILVKIDSDGQMNPAFIPALVQPILSGEADYVKGNRFFDIDSVRAMPRLRLAGNAGLSFLTKLSTGYWDLFDPTNGFTALHADVAAVLPLDKLHKRYFFESDMLFRLRCFGARIVEQPMEASYGDEKSNLSELNALLTFPLLHGRNFLKRIGYNYFLRGFDTASLHLIAGIGLSLFGIVFGLAAWLESMATSVPATAGTVLLGATPLLIGFQLLLAFLQHDVSMTPKVPIHPRLAGYTVLNSNKINKEGSLS